MGIRNALLKYQTFGLFDNINDSYSKIFEKEAN